MAIILKGTPKAKIGDYYAECESPIGGTREFCQSCRQFGKWAERITQWFTGLTESRVKAIARAILEEHDDILSSYCGNCFIQEIETCECFVVKYQALGLPLSFEILMNYDDCLDFGVVRTFEMCGVSNSWFLSCVRQICEICVTRTLDICNVPADEELARRLYQVELNKHLNRPTGDFILEQTGILFDGSTPQIVGIEDGFIYIYLGRPMTAVEIQLREFLRKQIPTPDFAEIVLVNPKT